MTEPRISTEDFDRAVEQIAADLKSHRDEDGPDKEADNVALGLLSGMEPEAITYQWAEARKARAQKEREALADRAKARLEQNVNVIQLAQVGGLWRPRSTFLGTALAQVTKQPALEPEQEPAPEPQPKAKSTTDATPPVLTANAPYDNAKEFIRRHCMADGETVVWFWQGQFWRWNGKTHYAVEPEDVMRGKVYEFLDGALKWSGNHQTVRFQPAPKHVNEVIDCLRTGLALGAECQPPMWLDTKESGTDCIAFRNKIVNVRTGEEHSLSHRFWVHSARDFDWQENAECPVWNGFLQDLFQTDEQSHEFIKEYLGYCMTTETKFQKAAMLIGPKRSGKGTVCYVLRRLVGDECYVGLSMNTWALGENSKQCLIGKQVGVFSDVRLKPGRTYGSSYDPGGLSHVGLLPV